jgi:hypothetical protein
MMSSLPQSPVAQAEVLPFPLPVLPERPPGSRRPHPPETIAAVRLLFERTCLSCGEIAVRCGVSQCAVSRWSHAGRWQRPPGAPKAWSLADHGLQPWALKGRLLARRLREIAERLIEEIEREPTVPYHGLTSALHCLQWARDLERRKPRPNGARHVRKIAEDMIEKLENNPDADPLDLAWVIKLLQVAREEAEKARALRLWRID